MTIQRKANKSWLSNERVRSGSLSIWVIVALFIFTVSCSEQAKRPAPSVPQGSVRVQLFDAYSALAVANTDVEVTSDNGIISITCVGRCPDSRKTWSGRSDDSGVLMIPASAIQVDTWVKVKDHQADRLPEVEIKDSSKVHQIELYPDWRNSEPYEWIRGYKLFNAHSGKVLTNTAVRVEFLEMIGPHNWRRRQPRRQDKFVGLRFLFISP
jgi:hypothetical protein